MYRCVGFSDILMCWAEAPLLSCGCFTGYRLMGRDQRSTSPWHGALCDSHSLTLVTNFLFTIYTRVFSKMISKMRKWIYTSVLGNERTLNSNQNPIAVHGSETQTKTVKKENRKNEKNQIGIPQAYLIKLYVWKTFCFFLQFFSAPRRHSPSGFFLSRDMWPIKRQANFQKERRRLLKTKSLSWNPNMNYPFKYFSTVYNH